MIQLPVKANIPDWFKPYGNPPDIITDATGAWYILLLGSINYQKETFQRYVFRRLPTGSVEWLQLNMQMVHAVFALSIPQNNKLWVFGLANDNYYYYQHIPGFVFSAQPSGVLTIGEESEEASALPPSAFSTELPEAARSVPSKVSQAVGRFRIWLSNAV